VKAGTAKHGVGLTLLDSLGQRESPDGFSNKGSASVGVGGKGIHGLINSLTLAKSASVAGGLESRGNNSGPAWVSLGQDWSIQGISIALSKALWGPVAVGSTSWVEAGTAKRSIKAIAKERLSVTLAQALWGPVAVGSTSWVDTGSAKSSVWAIAKEWLSVTLAQALRGPVAIGGTSWVEPYSAKSSLWAIAKERLSFTLAEALRGPVAVGGTGRVEAGTTQSTVRTISIKWVGSGQRQKR